MKIAVIYARYSSSNQTEQSIEGQVHVCEDYAMKNDILIVDKYIDRAMSGTNDNRDSFQRMIKDSNRKKWDYVLVYKLDRFARNKYESAIHKKHLKDNNVKLISATEKIPDTPEGSLMEGVIEEFNEYFSKELAQKVSRGLHESRMKGHCIGSVSYGYVKEKDKTLTINEEESLIINRIFQDYVGGKTILQISRDFEQEKITMKGRKFIPDTLRDILQRKRYTGFYELNGKQYNNIYPQVISTELFNQATERLNKTRYGCRKDNHEIFKLKDKIYCGCCNKKMYPVSTVSSNGQPLRFYKCIVGKKNDCEVGVIYKDFIENIVDRFILEQFTIPENIEFLTNKIYEINKKLFGKHTTLTNLKSSLNKTNNAITNIVKAIEQGIFTNTTKARLEELETKKIELEKDILIEESKQQFELTKEDIKNHFTYTMKKCPNRAIELFIKFIKVFDNKIEIGLNYALNSGENTEPITKKVFTEKFITTRQFKGGTIKTKAQVFDVYVVI